MAKMKLADLEGMKNAAHEFKKRKLSKADLFEALMNRQLSPFGKDIDRIKDKDFFEIRVTSEQKNDWMNWGVKFIIKNTDDTKLRDRKKAEIEMSWINARYGLLLSKKES